MKRSFSAFISLRNLRLAALAIATLLVASGCAMFKSAPNENDTVNVAKLDCKNLSDRYANNPQLFNRLKRRSKNIITKKFCSITGMLVYSNPKNDSSKQIDAMSSNSDTAASMTAKQALSVSNVTSAPKKELCEVDGPICIAAEICNVYYRLYWEDPSINDPVGFDEEVSADGNGIVASGCTFGLGLIAGNGSIVYVRKDELP